MTIKKSVTDMKLAANRANAKLSTGPRTERGKSFSKFNPLRLGLFAKHIRLPSDPNPELFAELLHAFIDEFCPVGPVEEKYVLDMVESRWKLHRASAAEAGIALMREFEANPIPSAEAAARSLLGVLTNAEQELTLTGTLSPALYEWTLRSMRFACRVFVEQRLAEHGNGLLNTVKVDDEFLGNFKIALENKDGLRATCIHTDKLLVEVLGQSRLLPDAKDLNNLLRYRRAAQRDFDSALKNLLEYQRNRKEREASGEILVGKARFCLALDANAFEESDAREIRRRQKTLSGKNAPTVALWAQLRRTDECIADLPLTESRGAVVMLSKFDAYAVGAGSAPRLRMTNEAETVLDIIARASRFHLLNGNRLVELVQTDDPELRFGVLGGSSPAWNRREWLNADRKSSSP